MPATTALVTLLFAFAAIYRSQPGSNDNRSSNTLDASHKNNPLLEWNATQTELDQTASAIEHLEAKAKKDN